MINKVSKMLKNRKGFTLVELMVVVVILGVLTSIAVPMYNKSQSSARENANKANIRIIDSAISMYMADNSEATLPTSDADWQTALVGKYIQEWPSPPSTDYKAYEVYKTDEGAWKARNKTT